MNFGVIMYQTSASKGQELVAQRMTRELAAYGKAVLLTSRFHDFQPVVSEGEVRRNGGYISYQDERLGVTVYRVESRRVDWPPRRIAFNNFVSILDRIVGELDLNVLITHSTLWNGPDIAALFASWKRRLGGGKEGRLLFCHMSHFQPPTTWRYSLQEREWRRAWNDNVLRRVIAEADLLLVTTPAEERHMVELGARRDKCFLFPGGIDPPAELTDDEMEGFRSKYGIPPHDKLVTFLGTVEERKNVAGIIRVAESLRRRRGIKFAIAGKLDGPYARRVLSESERTHNVVVLGEIPEKEKAALIRTSFLNLTMSKLEALGLVQLEFMSAGVPVVTSGSGGQSWVVKNRHTGVVLGGPEDYQGAASAILELAQDAAYRKRLGRNAEKFASQFTMKAQLKNLVKQLEKKRGVRNGTGPWPDHRSEIP